MSLSSPRPLVLTVSAREEKRVQPWRAVPVPPSTSDLRGSEKRGAWDLLSGCGGGSRWLLATLVLLLNIWAGGNPTAGRRASAPTHGSVIARSPWDI